MNLSNIYTKGNEKKEHIYIRKLVKNKQTQQNKSEQTEFKKKKVQKQK